MTIGSDEVGKFFKYDKMGEDSGLVGATAVGSSNAYVVTEKVHGANFCIIAHFDASGSGTPCIHFAKRTGVLGGTEDAEDFYSCRSAGLLRQLAPCGEAVLRLLAGKDPAVRAVHVYGELFGGSYPHPGIPASPGIEPVQVGVWYSPDLHFMAFDVAIETPEGRAYLSYDTASAACRQCGLLFAASLARGTLAECLSFEIEFETTLPARLGLPPLPAGAGGHAGNLAEGVVIRPQVEPPPGKVAVRSAKESARGIFKRKIEAFSEKRYQNDDWKKGKAGGGGKATAEVSKQELARIEMISLITEPRLAAVLSKIGRVDPKDKQACRGLLADLKEDVRDALDGSDLFIVDGSENLKAELDELCKALITQELVGRTRTVLN